MFISKSTCVPNRFLLPGFTHVEFRSSIHCTIGWIACKVLRVLYNSAGMAAPGTTCGLGQLLVAPHRLSGITHQGLYRLSLFCFCDLKVKISSYLGAGKVAMRACNRYVDDKFLDVTENM